MKNGMRRQGGFTIVELMIATTIFSFVMLICAAAITYVGRQYYKGVITTRTQDAARRVLQEIATIAQFSGTDSSVRIAAPVTDVYGSNVGAYCIGNTRFTYVTNKAMGTDSGKSRHVLWQDTVSTTEACTRLDMTQAYPTDPTFNTPQIEGSDLLSSNMRIPVLTISEINSLVNIEMHISYGDTADLFAATTPPYTQCVGIYSGGQFCASSNLKTNVTKRL